MDDAALVKLAASGRVRDLEEAWLALLEVDAPIEQWRDRAVVLETLVAAGRTSEAEAMATTALELLSSTSDDAGLVAAANAYLVVLKDSSKLREVAGALYRRFYADVPGLSVLLEEAGVECGRPARRAIRTMVLAVQLREGAYLTHRHEDKAARVERIDHESWRIQLSTGDARETLGAVELADNYEIASEDDFRVLARFDPDRLAAALRDDPAGVVTEIVRSNGYAIDSDALRQRLSPRFVPAGEWSKWWTRARQALRLSPHIRIEGRAPYYLRYDAEGTSFEAEIQARLAKAHDPGKELALVEEYVRGCKQRKQRLDNTFLDGVRERIEGRGRRAIALSGKVDLAPWLAAQRIGEMLEDENAGDRVVEALRQSRDPVESILAVEDPEFWPAACYALEQTHPDDLADAMARLLPHAPIRVADHLAERLIDLGCPPERFLAMADQILRDPIANNEGLLWMWNGPSVEQAQLAIPAVTLATKLLFALGELKRRDDISRAHAKRIVANSREVLRARNYERFRGMLEAIEVGVAAALRTEIGRLDNLGRVREDLLSLIRRQFPELRTVAPQRPKWLQDDTLYVTSAGHRRRIEAINELVNVKMKENAAAIGKAAALGDLSENSEYKFALEERDLLRARLAQMQQEMDIARVLSDAEVPLDYVGIGARAILEHVETGARQEITILGPWEADPEQRIFNYRTPVAQMVLGRRVDEVVKMDYFAPPGEYRVVQIASALAGSRTHNVV